MNKNWMLFLVLLFSCFVLFACGTVLSPTPYSQAKAQPADARPGSTRITQSALTGEWRSETGDVYTFQGSTFRSNRLNEGKPGTYEISPVLRSDLLVFYRDRNVESLVLFGFRTYYEPYNEQDRLDSTFAVLSEDRRTLTLGDKKFFKVGL